MSDNAVHRWPDFFIVGAPKAGTTLLHEQLSAHPDIFMQALKELRYFNRPAKGSSQGVLAAGSEVEYLALFASAGEAQVSGEALPQYLASPRALARIAVQCPQARIIMLLREPVSRAWSNDLMHRERGGKHRGDDFPAVVRRELEAGNRGETEPTRYVETGEHGRWVPEWLNRFGSENVGVFLFEDLKRDAQAFAAQVVAFLGLDSSKLPVVSGGRMLMWRHAPTSCRS